MVFSLSSWNRSSVDRFESCNRSMRRYAMRRRHPFNGLFSNQQIFTFFTNRLGLFSIHLFFLYFFYVIQTVLKTGNRFIHKFHKTKSKEKLKTRKEEKKRNKNPDNNNGRLLSEWKIYFPAGIKHVNSDCLVSCFSSKRRVLFGRCLAGDASTSLQL